MKTFRALFVLLAAASAASADSVHSAGPRIGVIVPTNAEIRQQLKDRNVSPVLTAFGWQFEYEYLNTEGGTAGLVELVPMAIGMESGLMLQTLNTMIGVRFANGIEIGFGPNVSAVTKNRLDEAVSTGGPAKVKTTVGIGMAGAIGITARSGKMNFPINLAGVRNENGFRVALLLGWTL